MRKGCAQIVKDSRFQARIGITYDNIANVQDKRDSGELPAENAGLPFGSWVPGLFNYLIEYKDKYYIRMALLHNDHSVRERRFLRNGIEVSVETAQAECLASEFKNLSDVDVISFPIDDIIEVNGESV